MERERCFVTIREDLIKLIETSGGYLFECDKEYEVLWTITDTTDGDMGELCIQVGEKQIWVPEKYCIRREKEDRSETTTS